MLFITQKKATDHTCYVKDILANIKLNLKLLFDYFVHRVASTKSTISRKDHCERIMERSVCFKMFWNSCGENFPFAENCFTGRPRVVDVVHRSPKLFLYEYVYIFVFILFSFLSLLKVRKWLHLS